MSFFVIEMQTNGNQGAVIPTAYADKADALAAAYTVAAAAVKSAVEIHTVMVVNSQGFNVIEPMVFNHGTEEPGQE